MKLSDIKEVLTFASFRPEPDDRLAPWTRRFTRKRTLFLNIGRGQTSWKGMGRDGRFYDGGVQYGEFKEIAARMADEWRGLTEDGWCAVSINSRYIISLETNVSRKAGADELIRTNPRVVLGTRYEKGKRYTFTNNPETVATILLTVDEEQIKALEGVLKESGLKPGRICCGTYAMMRRLLEAVHTGKKKEGAPGGLPVEGATHFLDVVCCEGSVCAMLENGDVWPELRSRADLYKDGDFQPVMAFLEPFFGRLASGASVRFCAETSDSPILAQLREKLPEVVFEDHSRPDHLWRTLADL
jgi:hypothetical protein